MDRFYRYNRGFLAFAEGTQPTQFREIAKCFVRKDHICGKFLGASKSCFVACPSTEEVEIILQLIIEKLTKIGIEPIIAIKERAYGQDIFCTKICGKIIESQFCIVILDDTLEKINSATVSIPNPNVYYEYGLMTSLGKHVIPLQKEGQELAFNIQTHDTIKYNPHNLSAELDRALKDATKITEEDRAGQQYADTRSDRIFIRSLEINGYQRRDYNWFLDDEINDTVFRGFGHATRREYIFFTLSNDKEALQNALTDAQVIAKRLESRFDDMVKKVESVNDSIEKTNKEIEEAAQMREKGVERITMYSRAQSMKRSLEKSIEERDDLSSKLELIQNSKFVMVLTPDIIGLKAKVMEQYGGFAKQRLSLPIYIGDINGIQIGDQRITFMSPAL